MAKTFESLYEETDLDGNTLEWEWDPEEMVFKATDDSMREYILRPINGELVVDDSETDQEDDDEDDDE